MTTLPDRVPRDFSPPSSSYFLFGPRGTGKTTLLNQLYPDSLRIDLLDPHLVRVLSAFPERLEEIVRAADEAHPVVIDEVQRVPELLSVVHRLIEAEGRRFVLTGSSARKLRRSGHDLLAGRALNRTLHPFTATELGDRFDLDRALSIGTIPLVYAADDPQDVLRSYAGLYVREEVKQEGLVRNAGDFARFLEAFSFSHGSQLNLSAVARDGAIERKTVSTYVEILHDLLLSFELPVFRKRAKRQVVHHPKVYLCDAGLYRSLRPAGPLDRAEEIGGAALEGLVIQMIRAALAYANADAGLYFWRTRHGLEVDCVVYGTGVFAAVEIKNSARVRDEDERGLRAFIEDYPEAKPIVVYRGDRCLHRRGIRWVPAEQFLANPGDATMSPMSAE